MKLVTEPCTLFVAVLSSFPSSLAFGTLPDGMTLVEGMSVGVPAIAKPLVFSSQKTFTRNDTHLPSSIFSVAFFSLRVLASCLVMEGLT